MRYIRQYKRSLYSLLLIAGKLNSYLANIDQQANEMLFRLVKQFAAQEGVNDALKAANGLGATDEQYSCTSDGNCEQ